MPNPLCHFEFMTNDPQRLRSFYENLFDWNYDDRSMPGYTLVQTGTEPTGGLFQTPPGAKGNCLTVYFQVPDLDSTLKKVEKSGGKLVVGKTPIPGVGHFAMITDVDGNTVGLMQPGAV